MCYLSKCRSCVQGCRHSAWGGHGVCFDDSAPATCSCDAGFASRDAFGDASCVPERVLVTGYIVLAAGSFVLGVLLVWQTVTYRYLRIATRRSTNRMRALVSCSAYVVGSGLIGIALVVRGGKTGLYDEGLMQVKYVVLLPCNTFGMMQVASFWVSGLPSQLLPAESCAQRLKNASEKRNIFLVLGTLNAATVSGSGILTILFPYWAKVAADTFMALGVITVGTVIMFVAVQTTRMIDSSASKSSAVSKAFYVKAKWNVWLQAIGFCGTLACAVLVGVLRVLTAAGQGTPNMLWYFQVFVGHGASGIFALTTRFEASAGRLSTPAQSDADRSLVVSARRAFVSVGATRFADMPLKHLVLKRRDSTDSENESTSSDSHTIEHAREKQCPQQGVYNPTERPMPGASGSSCGEEKKNDVSGGGRTGGAGSGPVRGVRPYGQQREQSNNPCSDYSVCSPTTGSSLGVEMEEGRLRHGIIGRKILPIEGIVK
ncbi:unnamed protein product [Ectocarpus sp. 12 AP-2014]